MTTISTWMNAEEPDRLTPWNERRRLRGTPLAEPSLPPPPELPEDAEEIKLLLAEHTLGDWPGAARDRCGVIRRITMNEHKELAIRALGNMMGDNTARARAVFRNCTPEQMQEQYGQSGQTRAQILAGYEEHDATVLAAINWVKSQRD